MPDPPVFTESIQLTSIAQDQPISRTPRKIPTLARNGRRAVPRQMPLAPGRPLRNKGEESVPRTRGPSPAQPPAGSRVPQAPTDIQRPPSLMVHSRWHDPPNNASHGRQKAVFRRFHPSGRPATSGRGKGPEKLFRPYRPKPAGSHRTKAQGNSPQGHQKAVSRPFTPLGDPQTCRPEKRP